MKKKNIFNANWYPLYVAKEKFECKKQILLNFRMIKSWPCVRQLAPWRLRTSYCKRRRWRLSRTRTGSGTTWRQPSRTDRHRWISYNNIKLQPSHTKEKPYSAVFECHFIYKNSLTTYINAKLNISEGHTIVQLQI